MAERQNHIGMHAIITVNPKSERQMVRFLAQYHSSW